MGKHTATLNAASPKAKKNLKGAAPGVSAMDNFSPGGRMQTSLSGDTKVYVDIKKFYTNGSVYGDEFSTDAMYALQFATSMPN
eukprot:1747131-Karenia_brevis.AAC.1